MYEWYKQVQIIIDEIDLCIKAHDDEALMLKHLSGKLGYSEFYISRKFKEISGMQFRDYLRFRRLAFALKEIRDTEKGILDIALNYGFSSHEAFTHAFKTAYGITPSEYRQSPLPVVLRTIIKPFDCYLLGIGGCGMANTSEDVKIYFVTIHAHKFLHIKNDDVGGSEANSGSGQIMAYINDPIGRICSWGIPLAECYGVRLPLEYDGEVPPQMMLIDVPEAEYIVFEHGPFDYEMQNCGVEQKIERAMKSFNYEEAGYCLDYSPGRIFYFYHDPARFWKYIRPVQKIR